MSGTDVRRVLEWAANLALPAAPTADAVVPRGIIAAAKRALTDEPPSHPCGQCGQRTPVCAEDGCGDSIIFLPKSGFGSVGEWQHLAPRAGSMRPHQPRPKVFVT